jgi:cobalt-precorrin 5A hydrolase/precorrin-3B C17-methyltransferase
MTGGSCAVGGPPAAEAAGGIRVVAATAAGARHGGHLADALPDARAEQARSARDAVADALAAGEALVCVMAVGACVRLAAPHLGDKHTDPPIVAVDDAARWAVCVAGAHHGGEALTQRVAEALGARAVVTTASASLGLPALDRLGAQAGLRLDCDVADVAAVGSALAGAEGGEGQRVTRWRDARWPTGPLPAAVVDADQPAAPGIAVTDRLVALPRPQVCYRPPSLVVGVGASTGAGAGEIDAAVAAALAEAAVSPQSVVALATVDAKVGEPGLIEVAERRGVPLRAHSAATLAAVDAPHPSQAAAAAVGTPSVAEAAALVEAGHGHPGAAELVVAKTRSRPPAATDGDAEAAPAPRATVAVARRPARGQLLLVSLGPGGEALVPPAARDALASAEVVLGLARYVEAARGWLRPGADVRPTPIGCETARAGDAVAIARSGARVALVSGGDVGVYAMASPTLESLGEAGDVDVEVVPGVTAASAAAAALGSPLGHDHCAISLSDLLTPWQDIARRVTAAAEGDFAVAFYNPRSTQRRDHLRRAVGLLAAHRPPDTPVGVVVDAARPGQRAWITTLSELDTDEVDMRTTVIVGSSCTRARGGRMVTPRGYA